MNVCFQVPTLAVGFKIGVDILHKLVLFACTFAAKRPSDMEPIAIEFTMNPDAYTRLMRRLASRRHFWYIGIGMAIFLIINRQIFKGPIYVWALPMLVFGLVFYFLLTLVIKRTFKVSTQLHHPLRYVFSDANITVESEQAGAGYEWSDFEWVRELPGWFVLYQNKTVFNPVPKSAFGSEEKEEQFRKLLQSKGLPIIKK